MTDTTQHTLAQQIRELIEKERAALLAGDFGAIEELLDTKQALVDQLTANSMPAETVAPLRDGLRRNQALFDQALAGLRTVANRLGDLNKARKSVNTYDSLGRKQSIEAAAKHKLERRA